MMYFPRALPERRTVHGLAVEYLVVGSGPPLLYLHPADGLDPEDAVVWSLARDFTVIAPSHPGFGATDLPRGFSTVDDLAYFYLDFLEAEDLREVTVVGISLGGWLAAEIATKSTERISRLVIAGALGLRVGDRDERDLFDLFQESPADWAKHWFARPVADERDFAAEPEEVALRVARNRETFTLLAWSPYAHNPKLRQRLHRIKVPTLVLWGEADRIAPVAYGRAYADRIPGAAFQLLPAAGHYAHIDQPDAFAAAVLAHAGVQSAQPGKCLVED